MRRLGIVGLLLIGLALAAPSAHAAPPPPGQDPFYRYDGAEPLAQVAPGTVLQTRKVPFHLAGVPLPLTAVQLLYRSTDALGRPSVNVTSVIPPVVRTGAPKLLSYQSAYDSLSPDDQPSHAIAGGALTIGSVLPNLEAALYGAFLFNGYTVTISDTEGQDADFAAGPEYGTNTLDAIRATLASPAVGLPRQTKVGLIGYSGGAIATEWAAELAPTYAPEVDRRLVGAAMGGVLVHPGHNLHYVDGSAVWAGVMPMAIIGIARAYDVDLMPYMSDYGAQVFAKLQRAPIAEVLFAYPGLTWAQLAKPEYRTPESVEAYVDIANRLIMGTGGTPSAPLFIGQGARGELEGTPGDKPGIGEGDGVMITGDVRSLARQYCRAGVRVQYDQYDALSHALSVLPWIPAATTWIMDRFAGQRAPQNCARIAPGNPLTPIRTAPTAAAARR